MRHSSRALLHPEAGDGLWTITDERELARTRLGVAVTEQTVRLPNGLLVSDYLQIRMPSYTTVMPVTCASEVICIRQYKHGVGHVALTLPGGSVEEGETPLVSAKRELLEETGYHCAHWRNLGSFVVGANQGICRAHLFLATQATKIAEPNSGDLEDMEITLLEPGRLNAASRSGEFPILSHACAIALSMPFLKSFG